MYWANFIHIYQPPFQKRSILKRVVKESYEKIFEGLLDNPMAKLTININAGLTEMLAENGHTRLISQIKKLLEADQIELTASAKYHPLLPLLPEKEIRRQIEINEKTNRKYFGPAYHPKGFFPPEMAYSSKIGRIVKDLGYQWIILDEVGLEQPINPTVTYQNQDGLSFFFRERPTSFKILSAQLGTAGSLVKELSPRINNHEYLLTAMDGETFGHHRPGLEELLWDICKEPQLSTITVSQILNLFPEKIMVEPKPSSWALTDNALSHTQPFIRWQDPKNTIHQNQWQLANLAIKMVEKGRSPKARERLDKALYSDQFWWACIRPWWSLEMIEQGADELVKVIRQAGKKVSRKKIEKAEKLYWLIVATGFEWQRSGKIEEMAKKEDEEIRQRMRMSLGGKMNKEDYDQIIESLKSQMLKSAENQEYAQAERFKNRIVELIAERDSPEASPGEIAVNQ